jgi:hypothetical protein
MWQFEMDSSGLLYSYFIFLSLAFSAPARAALKAALKLIIAIDALLFLDCSSVAVFCDNLE